MGVRLFGDDPRVPAVVHTDDVFAPGEWGDGLPRCDLTAAMAIAGMLPESLARYGTKPGSAAS
ncbi:hypothetical protein [Streptomyces sp. NPDC002082]|uniref:hypothetical protein n=1 Tax=Streptomyces sp. NPDC002082 TaxID=3154772 RepID=UPI00331701E1